MINKVFIFLGRVFWEEWNIGVIFYSVFGVFSEWWVVMGWCNEWIVGRKVFEW